jgi:phosphonopyruvate decarboxylase
MFFAEDLLSQFQKNNINFYTGVPDSVLKNFTILLEKERKNNNHIIAANEGLAVSLAIGYFLSSKNLALVYMQNSGLGNAINPLISVAHSKVYSTPLVILIGWRGAPKEADEPQHKLKGEITEDLLKLLDIKYIILNSAKDLKKITTLIKFSKKNNKVVAFLVKNNSISLKQNYKVKKNNVGINRYQFIRQLLKNIKKNTRIISNTGFTSRELYQIRKEDNIYNGKDFYMVGGMGHSSMVALGYSLKNKRQVICLDGDGSLMMHMGSLISTGFKSSKNYKHILLNNYCHESVGGAQIDTDKISFEKIVKEFGYKRYFKIKNASDVKRSIVKFLNSTGPSFLEVIINPGTLKKLSRPKNLLEIKKDFIK